jgi:pyruvate dehydrogenase E1 component alpha subunit/2-oxoisovalerate dehydrogenase E1 component alpha subunit
MALVDAVFATEQVSVKAFRLMLLARVLDDKFASLYRMGKIHGGVFLSRGQEALSVASGITLRSGDLFAPLIRDTAGRLAFGETLMDSARTYLGSVLGPMRGRDGNVHRGHPRKGMYAMISHLGAMISVVNGGLMAHRFADRRGTVGLTCLGDGATSTGAFHEGLNQAAVERLPLVLVVANNCYAYSTPTSRQFACQSLVDRAAGYGIQGVEIDGTDLQGCLEELGAAVARARDGGGPQLIVANLLRLCGHGEHDDAHYVEATLKASTVGRDCLKVAEDQLCQAGFLTPQGLAEWRREAVRDVENAVAQAQREPGPDPYQEDWTALSTKSLMEIHWPQ